jgi:5-methylphenazine-1-carboxylate 1-monooxygenase
LSRPRVVIVGGGICGLTLALALEQRSIECHVYESAAEIEPLGVGITLLPHGTRELIELGLLTQLDQLGVRFMESCWFNAFGQLIFRDPASGRWPQFLIHRSDLHAALLDAVHERLGTDSVSFGHACIGFRQRGGKAIAKFASGAEACADVVIGCDGIHSAIRAQLYPNEGDPVFSGVNLWRGVTRHEAILSGGTHARVGTLARGKLVLYPIRNEPDGERTQLLNWVAELRDPHAAPAAWNHPGRLEDFAHLYADWRFDWLDVPELLRCSERILQYPMSDRDPLPRWSFGRVTLAGDAAHPMVPRGSNGGMQAILDARSLADALASEDDATVALERYEAARRPIANRVVLTNRVSPPDTLIQMVEDRAGHQRFEHLGDIVSQQELRDALERYKGITGYNEQRLAAAPKTVAQEEAQ